MPFRFFNKGKLKKPLLTVDLNGTELCAIQSAPIEEKLSAQLKLSNPILTFTDSDGCRYSHDLTSVVDEGCSWIHLSIRVHDGYACQADCLVNNSEAIEDVNFQKGEIKGIRFQPFYLPQCQGNTTELIGQGLFYRGLHFSGTITPGNVSSSCICDFCRKSFRIQSFHAGFGNNAYFYCSKGMHTLVISSYIEGAPAPLGHPDPEALTALESRLPKCKKCGGDFKYLNPLLCPHCHKPFIDFIRLPQIRDNEYYGNYLYGSKIQEWDEANKANSADAKSVDD